VLTRIVGDAWQSLVKGAHIRIRVRAEFFKHADTDAEATLDFIAHGRAAGTIE